MRMLMTFYTVVPLYPMGTCSKIPGGHLKLKIVQNPTYIFFLYVYTFSSKGSTLQLLFSMSKLPASLFLQSRTITQKTRGYLDTSPADTLISDRTAERRTGGSIQNPDTLDKGVIHVPAGWGRTAPDFITLLRKVCDLN